MGLPSRTLAFVLPVLLAFFAFFAFGAPRTAHACRNAVMQDASSMGAQVRAAEHALDRGDVLTARELATEAETNFFLPPGPEDERYHLIERAVAIEALSYVRDPKATPEELDRAANALEHRVFETVKDGEKLGPTPALLADLGEAEERAGRDKQALAELVPLADKDLIGSAYAYAALSRAARRSGDVAGASRADARCRTMAADLRACDGVYPKAPLFRGGPLGYALPFLILGAATLRRRLRRAALRPWTSHRERLFAGLSAGAAVAIALGVGLSPFLAAFLATLAAVALALAQPRAFLRAAKEGTVTGLVLRPTEPTDIALPRAGFYLVDRRPQTLDRLADASYREAPRRPFLRVERAPLPFGKLILVTLSVSVPLLFVAAFFLTARKAARSPSIVQVATEGTAALEAPADQPPPAPPPPPPPIDAATDARPDAR